MAKGFLGILELSKCEDATLFSLEEASDWWKLYDKSSSHINTSSFVSMEDVISISQRPSPKSELVSGYFEKLTFQFNGMVICLLSHLQFSRNDIIGGSIEMMNAETKECYMVFAIEKWPYFRIKKIMTDDLNEFLLIQSGKNSVSDNVCTGLWIVGKLDNEIFPFIDIKVLKKIGLIYQDIASSIEDGAIKLLGYARDRDCRIWSQNREIIGYQYRGHIAYPIFMGDCGINAVHITWNNSSMKFFIRLEDDLSTRMTKHG